MAYQLTVFTVLLCWVAPMMSLEFQFLVLQFDIRLFLVASINVIKWTTAIFLKKTKYKTSNIYKQYINNIYKNLNNQKDINNIITHNII